MFVVICRAQGPYLAMAYCIEAGAVIMDCLEGNSFEIEVVEAV